MDGVERAMAKPPTCLPTQHGCQLSCSDAVEGTVRFNLILRMISGLWQDPDWLGANVGVRARALRILGVA